MKKFIGVIAAATILSTSAIRAFGADFTFDPNYYARKYPDVVAVLGTDPTVLENHYLTSGITEGRFVSQAEETYYYENNMTKKKEVSVAPVQEKLEEPITNTTNTTKSETVNVAIKPAYNTYIDVDIDNQIMTYFEDGVIKLQSPCVTGNPTLKRDTPKGTYSIKVHCTDKTLVGPTWRVKVNYWMRFTDDACGLHDASWRSNFGGDIYLTNGSHGCVNLPSDVAKSLYDSVDVGTTVYVH